MAHNTPQQCVLLNELFDRGFKHKQNKEKAYPKDRRITPNHRRSDLVEEIFVWLHDENLLAWVETVFIILSGALLAAGIHSDAPALLAVLLCRGFISTLGM